MSLELFSYGDKVRAQRQGCPGHDLISRLMEPLRDGSVLSALDFNNFFTLLVATGNDTTRWTAAAGLEALINHPTAIAELQTRPELMPTAVEEMLRWASVTMHFRRTATEDYRLHDKTIRAGDKVTIWFIAADFDERQFPDPYTFDIHRTPNDHVAFGLKSPHKCLGEHLARLEVRLLFEELLPQIQSIRINGPIERMHSNFITGIKHLPVQVVWR